MSGMDRVTQLQKVQTEARELFAAKNADYGDAFANYGPVGVLVRMGDKLARLQSITKRGVTLVNNESLRDSLIDLHNYSAMAVMLLDEVTDPPEHNVVAEHDVAEHDVAEHDVAEHDVAEHDVAEHETAEEDLVIDEETLKDILISAYSGASTSEETLNEVSLNVYDIVCREMLDIETCKTLVSAVLDTYIECDLAAAYLAVSLRMAYEGEDILGLDAALRAREPLESHIINESQTENILIAEAGVGVITH